MEEKITTRPMWKFSILGFVELMILTFVAVHILKLNAYLIPVPIGFAVGGTIALWFAKSEKRKPTSKEIYVFLLQYGAAIILSYSLSIFLRQSVTYYNEWIFLHMLLNLISYLLCAYTYMTDRWMGKSIYSNVLGKG